MTEPTTPKPRRRRWFALSLRGAMIAVLIVGGLLGWKVNRARVQRRAIATIKQQQGSIVYDWNWNGGPLTFTLDGEPPGPGWLRRILGDEFFQEITVVTLSHDDGPEGHSRADQLACMDGVDSIKWLRVFNMPLEREGMERVSRMTRLQGLTLWEDIQSASRNLLGNLVNLEYLTIAQPGRGDRDGLAFLARLPRLRSLDVVRDPVSEADLIRVGRVARLESLSLIVADLTDLGLAHLAKLDRLKSLQLKGTGAVTDAGLAHLASLPAIETLDLGEIPVSDASFRSLCRLPKLTSLRISSPQIGQHAIEDVLASRPKLSIRNQLPSPPPPIAAP